MTLSPLHILIAATVLMTAPARADELFDIDFDGGTMTAYVDVLRRAAGNANIVVTPEVARVRITPLRLTHVSLEAALKLIQGDYVLPDESTVVVNFQASHSGDPALRDQGEITIYKLEAQRTRNPRERGVRSHVWSLAPILAGTQDPEPVLTAIEAALDLEGGARGPAEVRFHRETRLLLVRAEHAQLEVIDAVLSELREHSEGASHEDELAETRVVQAQVQADFERALATSRGEAESLRRAVVAAETRAEVLGERIAMLETERLDIQNEMRRVLNERDAIERRLHQMESREKER